MNNLNLTLEEDRVTKNEKILAALDYHLNRILLVKKELVSEVIAQLKSMDLAGN